MEKQTQSNPIYSEPVESDGEQTCLAHPELVEGSIVERVEPLTTHHLTNFLCVLRVFCDEKWRRPCCAYRLSHSKDAVDAFGDVR
jgi:hypothetical protein